ncbi:MAG: HDIG domain-containing protein, partial [Firmicutes bacterium]|nr:HDIG domain-containing protein [Bacillota bacterium]
AAYTVWRKASRFSQIIRAFLFSAFFYGMIVMFDAVQGAGIPGHDLAYGALNGLAASFTPLLIGMLLQPVLESVFNLLTDTRLVGFTDINAPLIKRLSVEAPGTFSHSLVVASFAEMCASSIGVNPYLARACAYYHDIGKLENSEYFKENQDEVNHHDNLLPEVSAEIVRAHTYGGLDLCEKHRIPREIAHVTVQHHGTMLIPVFYEKAKSLTDGEVAKEGYRYQGITPRSKVAAIIMLCDAAEAALRVMEQPNAKKVDKLLSGLISDRIATGQFDRCDISLAELNLIKKTITQAYGGIYHTRIKYPTGESLPRVSTLSANREVKREE